MFDYYIDILKGVPKNHWGNAFIMQSDKNLQNIIERATYLVYTFNTDRKSAIETALKQYGLSLDEDFTDPDRKKILDWI